MNSAPRILRFDGPATAIVADRLGDGLPSAPGRTPGPTAAAARCRAARRRRRRRRPWRRRRRDVGHGSSSEGQVGGTCGVQRSHTRTSDARIPERCQPVVDTTVVQVRPLTIDGAFEITPVQHADDRGAVPGVVQGADVHRARRPPVRPRPGEPLGLGRRRAAWDPLLRRPARPGQVRDVHPRRRARRRRRHPRRLADVRPVGQRPARRRRPPPGVPRRGPRPRVHVPGGRHDDRVPLLDRLRPWSRARRRPARPGHRHHLAGHGT